jgi:type II secretory pathway component PulJ
VKQIQGRHGFTLLEIVLATVISTTVAGVCLGLFIFFDRTDARLQDRFVQNDQLSRLHLVSERAFGKLLMAEKPASLREAEQRLRNPNDKGAGLDSTDGTQNPDDLASRARSREKRLDFKNNAELEGIRAQIPPRLDLALQPESRVDLPVERDATGDFAAIRAQRFTTVPQRLELVVSQSPVPTASPLDDPEALMARVQKQRAREKQQLRRMLAVGESVGGADNGDPGGVEDFNFDTPMRALRGAFELHPMVPTGSGMSPEARGWEVWWVPLPPEAGPDEELDTEAPAPDEPFLVASDIAFIEWKVFQGRERRTEYVARLNDEIPAYVEVEVETIGGLRANWLFELQWTFGHESRPTNPPAAPGAAPGSTPQETPGQPISPTPGVPKNVPGRPIEPSNPSPMEPIKPGQKVPKTIKPGGSFSPIGPSTPIERPGKKHKGGAP